MQYKTFTTSAIIRSGGTGFKGYNIAASGAAVVEIYDGTDDSGSLVLTLHIPITTAQTVINPQAIEFGTGCYVKVVSGTVSGSIFWD